MIRKTATTTVLAGGALLAGCAADTTTLDATNHGPAMDEPFLEAIGITRRLDLPSAQGKARLRPASDC